MMSGFDRRLETSLRREAEADRPAFSEALHARVMSALRRERAGGRGVISFARAAAVALLLGGIAALAWLTFPARRPPAVAERPTAPQRALAEFRPPTREFFDDVMGHAEALGDEMRANRFASLDRDASRFGRFLLDQIPRAPVTR